MSNVPLCGQRTFCLFISLSMNTGLFTPFGYCKYCCYKHGYTNTVFSIWFKFFFVYNQRWSCWSNGNSMFNFFKEQSHCFPCQLYHSTLPPAVHKEPSSFIHMNTLVYCCRGWFCFVWLVTATQMGVKWYDNESEENHLLQDHR